MRFTSHVGLLLGTLALGGCYNWQADSSNAGNDWFFMGGNGQASPVAGHMVDSIIEKNLSTGAKTVVSVLTGAYINRSSEQTCSFPVSIYGPQQEVNPYNRPNGSECGNGVTLGGAFGETSVRVESSASSRAGAYAALRDGAGALTLFVANKTAGGLPATFVVAGHRDGVAAVYQFGAASPNAITRLDDVIVSAGSFEMTLGGDSATMIVIP